MNKIMSSMEAIGHVKDGDVIMIGGFLQGATPEFLLQSLLNTKIKDLTIISNDTGTGETSTIKLQQAGRVVKVIASYIGANTETVAMIMRDPASVQLVPQGTLAERIRSGGAGLGGFLTPTGIGTITEQGKQILSIEGREYLLETPLRADVALVHAAIVDEIGNCFMRGSSKNFNALMPQAADFSIVEAEKVVPVGELDPEMITVPGLFIDAIVKVGK